MYLNYGSSDYNLKKKSKEENNKSKKQLFK